MHTERDINIIAIVVNAERERERERESYVGDLHSSKIKSSYGS